MGDKVREKTEMNNFAIMSADDEGQKREFIAKTEFTERSDLFEYMESELGTSFLKCRPVLAQEKWRMLFDKAPSSWPEFLCQVLALAEQAILGVYQSSTDASKSRLKEPLETMTASVGRPTELTDEQIASMLEGTPAERVVDKCAKRKARKKRQALLKTGDDEDGDESTLGESVIESTTEETSSTMLDSILCSSGGTRCPLPSTTASAGIDDDRVSVSTMDTALLSPGTGAAEDEELHVDWSAANPVGPAAPLRTVQESVELEVDWNEPEETRWSASMVDAFTGVSAEWHWTTTPRPMLTCGNLRAHIKNTFLEGIYKADEFPAELARSKSVPAPPRRRWNS